MSDEPIFAEAIVLSGDERSAYLDKACGGDAVRRARIVGLISAHETDDPALEPPAAVSRERLSELSGDVIGRYKLLQRIGEGGCGVVWLAEQAEPVRRRVALKVIKLGMDTRAVVARFEAERQALALMDHPNIARVFDAGATQTGRPYFVMELVRGVPITKYCDDHALDPRQRLELFIKVCQAVQHAHQKGIIHRDLKPSNILVAVSDNLATPKVIDFGIAKATQGRLTDSTVFTAFEQFMGTPAYMSPEQAESTGVDIDTRSDVYSLGVLLYELLAGCQPFDAHAFRKSGIDEIRRKIRESEPLRPSRRLDALPEEARRTVGHLRRTPPAQLSALLRGDLDWIVMRCLEKDRTLRYDTPNALAIDIQRHLDSEPVAARPPSTAYLVRKFYRRNRVAVIGGLSVAGVLVVGTIVSSWLAVIASNAEATARARELDARRSTYQADMSLAQNALGEGNLDRAITLLEKYRDPGQIALRDFTWRYFWDQSRSDENVTIGRNSGVPGGMAISVRGLIAANVGTTIEIRSFPSGALVKTLEVPDADTPIVGVLRFTPDGDWLVSGRGLTAQSNAPRLLRWNTQTWQMAPAIAGIGPPYTFPAGGDTLVAYNGSAFSIWNIKDWSRIRDLAPAMRITGRRPQLVAASVDGKSLFIASGSGIRCWRTDDFTEMAPMVRPFSSDVTCLGISADGILAAGDANGTVALWDVASRQLIQVFANHSGSVVGVSFSPDGSLLASAGADQTIALYNPRERRFLKRLRGHLAEISTLAFSSDSSFLLSSSALDGTLRRWPLQAGAAGRESEKIGTPIAFLASGRQLLCWSEKDGFGQWDLERGGWTAVDFKTPAGLDAAKLGRGVVAAPGFSWLGYLRDGHAVIGNLSTGEIKRELVHDSAAIQSIAISGDGKLLATGGANGEIRVWRTGDWSSQKLPVGAAIVVSSLAFSPDGSRLAARIGPKIRLFDVAMSKLVLELDVPDDLGSAPVFSPDGTKLAIGQLDKSRSSIRIWDFTVRSDRPVATLTGHLQGVRGLAFSPDGRTLVSCGNDILIKLWSMETYQEIVTLPSARTNSDFAQFSPDGTYLAVGSADGQVQFWHAPGFAEIDAAPRAAVR